jgi:hypothetical protein
MSEGRPTTLQYKERVFWTVIGIMITGWITWVTSVSLKSGERDRSDEEIRESVRTAATALVKLSEKVEATNLRLMEIATQLQRQPLKIAPEGR